MAGKSVFKLFSASASVYMQIIIIMDIIDLGSIAEA